MSEWKPIETAPKGRLVLLANINRMTIEDWGRFCVSNQPGFTHWMPLPEPPNAVPPKAADDSQSSGDVKS